MSEQDYAIDRFRKNQKLYKDYHQQFSETFLAPLKRFWDNLFGLDIIEFDIFIGPPDGTSLEEFITDQYGEEAADLIRILLK